MIPPSGQERVATRTVLFILVLAAITHLCSVQLAHGGEPREKFITNDTGVIVEMRPDATVHGAEIRLKQLARWSDTDKSTLDPIADLIVARFAGTEAFRSVSISDVKALLRDANVNVSTMNFVGSAACTVTRGDAKVDQGSGLDQWSAAKQGEKAAASAPEKADATPSQVKFEGESAAPGTLSLRQLLTNNLADRLNLPAETLQVTFRAQDEKTLRLSQPQFTFTIEGSRAANLGDVTWNVTANSGNGAPQRFFVAATARAWQEQLVVSRPLSTKQQITEGDVTEKRSLVDRLSSDPLVRRDQVVGQLASRDLKAGTVMTGKLIDPVQLVKSGQYVTIEHGQGGISIKIVAKALDSGCYGQTIRVKNEATREIFRVTVCGAQQGSLDGLPGNTVATAQK
jgi:flagella basal body P-ring formation protein FlgA